MPNRDLTALLLLTVLSCACGGSSPLTPSTTEAHPRTVDTNLAWTASSLRPAACTLSLSTAVKGFTAGTVAVAVSSEGCPVDPPEWSLLTNPDGVVYTIHDTLAGLHAGTPSALPGRGKYLHLLTWLNTSPVCVEVASGGASARVGLVGSGCDRPTEATPLDGCPIIIGLGAKGYELPHPGQWLRASYTMSICGPDEWSNQWTVTPQPALMDICENSTALAAKQCGHAVGKFLWIGTPGVYDVTATAPGGVGTTTLYGVVVD